MSFRYKGGVISATPPTTTGGTFGTAPGVWTLPQQLQTLTAGNWPSPPPLNQFFSWGRGTAGQLGTNTAVTSSSPVQVGSLTNWYAVSSGWEFGTGVKTNGTLWSWGANGNGELGLNTASGVVFYSSPKQVGALTNWLTVSSGGYHTLAIKTTGTLWSWGAGGVGRLGHNNTVSQSSPKQVGALTTWSKISARYLSSFAIKTDGTLWAWGFNTNGILGLGNVVYYSSPVQVGALTNWSLVDAGNLHTLAIKTDGTLWVWGSNSNGQLGLNVATTVKYSSPKQIGALTTWRSVSAGYGGHSIALKTDGTIWAWGLNSQAQLGLNNLTNYSSPKQIGALTTWLSITAGAYYSLAIRSPGSLWAWGYPNYGSTGLDTTVYNSSPKQVGALTTWTYIDAEYLTTFALKSP